MHDRALAIYADPAFRSSAGIERYTRELIRGIAASPLGPETVLLCTRQEWEEELRRSLSHLEERERPSIALSAISGRMLRLGWSFLGRPTVRRLVGRAPAVTHSPVSIRFPGASSSEILTVHDVHPTRVPTLMAKRERLTLTRTVEARAIRSAGHIIADSKHTAADVRASFGRGGDEVTVVSLGIDHSTFCPITDQSLRREVRRRYGVDGPYILYAGSLYSRKIGRLLEAFRLFSDRAPGVRLVLTGGREVTAGAHAALDERLRGLGLEDLVVRTGPVPDADLAVLMSAAEIFVYVSLYEGFGLAVLEAMACGAAVIAADNSSLPDVVGDAGVLVSPIDEARIAHEMEALLTDRVRQEQLRRRARERARGFSWERTVRETMDIYHRILEGRNVANAR